MNSFLIKCKTLYYHVCNGLNYFFILSKINRQLQSQVNNEIETSLSRANETYYGVVNVVKSRGFYIIQNALSNDVLNQMRQEFRTIIDETSDDFYEVDRHEGSVCVRLKPVLTVENAKKYPAIYSFFNSVAFRKLAKIYYSDEKASSEYMSEIFVHETPKTNDPLSGQLHWDRVQTLKFWVYIDDVSDSAGPMIVEEFSPKRNRELRVKMQQEKSTLVGGLDNILEQVSNNLIPMTAPAGSILIHNTDASHGASNVQQGMVRKIIRGHCRAR